MKRQTQKRQTRQRVLEAARVEFSAQGYEGTTIAAVAERARVAVGTVIAHFPDKPSLVAAAFHEGLERTVSSAWRDLPARSLLEQLLHLARRLYEAYAVDPALSRVLLRETLFLGGEWGEAFDRQIDAFTERIASLVGAAQERGELAAELPPGLVAVGFFADYFACLLGGLKGRIPTVEAQVEALEGLTRLRLRVGEDG